MANEQAVATAERKRRPRLLPIDRFLAILPDMSVEDRMLARGALMGYALALTGKADQDEAAEQRGLDLAERAEETNA